MADDILTEDKVKEFIDGVGKLRNDGPQRNDMPVDIVRSAAKRMGIGSCAQELTYSAMRIEVNSATRRVDELRFWIEASCGVSFGAGEYTKDWLENFGKRFISEITREDDLPNLRDLNIGDKNTKIFSTMLNASIAYAESKGKVGGKALKKCIGFRAVKYWGEEAISGACRCGFTEEDRLVLRSLAQCCSIVPQGQVGVRQGAVSANRRPDEAVQQELKSALSDKDKLQTRLCDAERKNSCLEKELSDVTVRLESMLEKIRLLEEEVKLKEDKLTKAEESKKIEIDELRRTIARNENKAATVRENIHEGLSTIYNQLEASEKKPDDAELCRVLKVYLKRVFETLSKNGYAF
jgi:hypothetical protein